MEEAPPRVYSGQQSARQLIEGWVTLFCLVAVITIVTSFAAFSASLSQALIAGGSLGLATTVLLIWAQLTYKSPGYTLYPDRVVEGPWRGPRGIQEKTLLLRDVGHLGYDGRSCVLRSGPRSEDCLTVIMRPEEMDDFWEHLLQSRNALGSEPPYSVHQKSGEWLSDPYVLERDPTRLSGELQVSWERNVGHVASAGAGQPVRFVLDRGGMTSHNWLLTREGESRPRLGIRNWSISGNASLFDVFDVRGVHVARIRGLRNAKVMIDSRTLDFAWEDGCEVVREGERVLLEFHGAYGQRIVLYRALPQALVELLVLAHAATHRVSSSD